MLLIMMLTMIALALGSFFPASVVPFVADAYITSPGALPPHRQRQFLQEMTRKLVTVKPGQLSTGQLAQAPDLMYAWSHCSQVNKENALAVESLVKRLVDEQRAGNRQALNVLTVEDYNCLLEGWARAGQGVAAAERCEQIVTAMLEQGPQPNLSSFKAVLMAWRLSWNLADFAPLRAQRIVEQMIRLYESGQHDAVLPDADCFDIVLQLWSRSRCHAQAPQQTEQLLAVMEALYKSTGRTKANLKPRTTSFNAVLAAWAKASGQASDPYVAQAAAERACHVLSFMEMLHARGDDTVAPDNASYCTVMGALTHTADSAAAARQADAFLRRLETSALATMTPNGRGRLVPDTILFNTAMGLWAKANVKGAYRKARSILDRQLALYDAGWRKCKPDVYGFTSVIASCAAETGPKAEKQTAFSVATATFTQLQERSDLGEGPNHVTYGAMLKACAKLLPSSSPLRQEWARNVFEDCCRKGYVGDMVVSRLREAASPDMYKELMQGHGRRDLPSEWTVNVHEMNAFRRKKSTGSVAANKRKRAEV
jgi:hypothetical protein